jgi:hypothetical protein
MTRRRRINVEPLPTVEYGDLAPGCAVAVEGMPGEWVFMYARREASGLVVATINGGPRGRRQTRSVDVRRVERKRETKEDAA